jgi:hypothetical protein
LTPVIPPYRRGGGFGSMGLRFEEVVEPPPVSMVPETLGAWLTLGVLAAALLSLVAYGAWRWHRRAHRRAAAREMLILKRLWATDPAGLDPLEAVPVVLKRCALGSFTRARVAALSGADWLHFLDVTGGAPFGEDAGRALQAITTRGAGAAAAPDVERLFAAALTWVRRHHADV